MLTEKKIDSSALSAVQKKDAKIIKLHTAVKAADIAKKETRLLLPPPSQFNMGYLKAKDNDPL